MNEETKAAEGTKGYVYVIVEKAERPLCDFCAFDNKRRIATHVVTVTHNFRWMGATASMRACAKHATEIKAEFERQAAPMKYARPAKTPCPVGAEIWPVKTEQKETK